MFILILLMFYSAALSHEGCSHPNTVYHLTRVSEDSAHAQNPLLPSNTISNMQLIDRNTLVSVYGTKGGRTLVIKGPNVFRVQCGIMGCLSVLSHHVPFVEKRLKSSHR